MYLFIYFLPCCAACGILISQPGIEPAVPTLKVQSLNYWTTGEIPGIVLCRKSFVQKVKASLSETFLRTHRQLLGFPFA